MPRISEFYGIAIYLYYRDHAPPHFHAIYAGREGTFDIDAAVSARSDLPPRAEALVMAWARRYKAQLLQNWERAREGKPLLPIAPLE